MTDGKEAAKTARSRRGRKPPPRPSPSRTRALGEALGETIERERRKRRLTQAGLAQLCGISRRHLAAIESGANFTVTILFAILRALPGMLLPVGALMVLSAMPEAPKRRN